MNFIDAQNIATMVDRYKELKRNIEQMECDVNTLLKKVVIVSVTILL